MFTVKNVIHHVRIKNKDLNETRFSDWDIINAVNEALRFSSNEFALRNSDFFEKEREYTKQEVANGANLPDDYITLRKVIAYEDYILSPSTGIIDDLTYMITNNKLYAKTGVKLMYKGFNANVGMDDTIELPDVFIDSIVKLTGLILNNAETDILMKFVADAAERLIPRRRYSNIKTPMPFHV